MTSVTEGLRGPPHSVQGSPTRRCTSPPVGEALPRAMCVAFIACRVCGSCGVWCVRFVGCVHRVDRGCPSHRCVHAARNDRTTVVVALLAGVAFLVREFVLGNHALASARRAQCGPDAVTTTGGPAPSNRRRARAPPGPCSPATTGRMHRRTRAVHADREAAPRRYPLRMPYAPPLLPSHHRTFRHHCITASLRFKAPPPPSLRVAPPRRSPRHPPDPQRPLHPAPARTPQPAAPERRLGPHCAPCPYACAAGLGAAVLASVSPAGVGASLYPPRCSRGSSQLPAPTRVPET
ncbi:hypothetical protein FHS42_001805 [Streptomyces zagrosensis]|uniref:Uncharacterized protein n=1 Tax=Streptomyces zagrosensis TaxID=1042984 RepID=A0A7W9UXC8_9ACTN|nr:hypothetical protein [Streptomyces zagrosensis]